jgi:hypothetical protein
MYEFSVIGQKNIIEDQIQGRDEPYLYNVDHKPLEFTINIAFENYETIDEVSKVIRWLYNPKTYKRLTFEDMDTNFFAIFVGSPEYYYIGNNNAGFQYIGYITCQVRTNAPYGYTDILTNEQNTGDLPVYPSFQATSANAGTYTITNTIDNETTTFTYTYAAGETVTFNGYTKTLSSSVNGKNPYAAWDKDYLILEPEHDGVTNTVTNDGNLTITYSYRAPKYL